MPLFYQHNINENTRIGLWKIEEPEHFFLEKVPGNEAVTHPYKRLQHLAGRYLLPVLYPDFPSRDILIADTRKPFLPDEKYHFSISHCGNFAGAIVSSVHRVGMDIEMISVRLRTISPKFVDLGEKFFLQEWETIPSMHLQLTTLLWSAKEAVYKWYGNGKIDFRGHIQLKAVPVFQANGWIRLQFMFMKEDPRLLVVHARVFDSLVMAYLVSEG